MLGRLKMDIGECIAAYTSMFENIFGERKHKYPVNVLGNVQGRFHSKKLRKSITEIVESKGLRATDLLNNEREGSCRV